MTEFQPGPIQHPDAMPQRHSHAPSHRHILEAIDLHKNLGGSPVVRGVSFQLREGEVVGLLGANGAGKTTTLLMLAGALRPDSGQVRLFGSPRQPRNPDQNRYLGFVPQQTAIYPGLSVRENLAFFGGFYVNERRRLELQIEETLAVCDLAKRCDDRAGTLSSGLQRRLSLGVALVHRPRILILDEATVGLDYRSRARVFESLLRLAGEGAAILFATHLWEEAESLCSRVILLDEGRVAGDTAVEGLTAAEKREFFGKLKEPK